MAKLVIIGAGDIARLARYYFEHDSDHQVAAFAVDREYLSGTEFQGLPLLSIDEMTGRYPAAEYAAFVALSYARMNRSRAAKYAEAKANGYRLVSYLSSRCSFLTDHPI